MSARWTRATARGVVEPTLLRLVSQARGLSTRQMAAFVNATINRSVRNPSGSKCTDDGYWASAGESVARGIGDCVDIAVAKMTVLRTVGVAADDMFLISGRRNGGVVEAALLIRFGGTYFLLAAGSDSLTESSDSTAFVPIVTYGVAMTWAHGIPVGKPRLLKPEAVAGSASNMSREPRDYGALGAGMRR